MGPKILIPGIAGFKVNLLKTGIKSRKVPSGFWGDSNPRNDNDVAIWRAIEAGIAEGVGGNDKALMAFHPQPNKLN